MKNTITSALTKLFEQHRIVFWYDSQQELRAEFESLELENVEKIELKNNEFGVKYRILRQQPQQKFLLYHQGQKPENLNNWLLDVELAQGEFRADQESLWLVELNLGLEFTDVVKSHREFFNSRHRLESLKELLKPNDSKNLILLKMLSVCVNASPRIDSILEKLLEELAQDKDEKMKLCLRTGLNDFLWQQMKLNYGYTSEKLGILDFVVELFKSCYYGELTGKNSLNSDAVVFLKRWQDSRQFAESFEKLSHQCAKILKIEDDLNHRNYHELINLDYFDLIDRKIISDLVKTIINRTIAPQEVSLLVKQRQNKYWYQEFEDLYLAIDYGSQFIQRLDQACLTIPSIEEGFKCYCQSWFHLDFLYRKFIYHSLKSGQTSLMAKLSETIENLYINKFLLKINNHWHELIDSISNFQTISLPLQRNFFRKWVEPFIKKDKKVCVIISDALRFEIGAELVNLIRQEDRYEAQIEGALAMLPSYTQLGMAALLPHQELEIRDKNSVMVDQINSQGLENRQKILAQAFQKLQKKATAIKAEQLLKLNRDQSRSLFREHDVVYVYHNHIDAIADKRDTEAKVFEAVEETMAELILLVKKLTGANASNLLISADHGFLYQDRVLEESDFSTVEVGGEEIYLHNRRFIIGKDLKESEFLTKWEAKELGLTGDIEIQIPKSINRLRVKGAGSRFVHGGATLQEMIIPVVKINKKRRGDLSIVEVEIIRNSNSTITSGQLAVTFYQEQPVTAKIQPRILQTGIYTKTGELISDQHELNFDFTSQNPREREIKIRFMLTSKANDFNNQEVFLKLTEKLSDTSHYTEYKSIPYTIRRSFTSDFDF